MSNRKLNLLVVAHPGDETLFFAGLCLRSKRAREKKSQTEPTWKIVCATDGNADGKGKIRKKQFEKACGMLGVTDTEWWGFQDIYEKRLPTQELVKRLQGLPRPHTVYTHGIIGEYGHPHHQDISYAVHHAFAQHERVFSVAYNSLPEKRIQLTKDDYLLKAKILTTIYGSETSRFLNLLPVTFTEDFQRLTLNEVTALYKFFAEGKPLSGADLHVHAWLANYLRQNRERARPF